MVLSPRSLLLAAELSMTTATRHALLLKLRCGGFKLGCAVAVKKHEILKTYHEKNLKCLFNNFFYVDNMLKW